MTNGNGDAGHRLKARAISLAVTATDLEASVRFYTEGLGFEVIDRVEDEGRVRFCMMRAGEAMLGVGQDDFEKGRDRSKGVGMRIFLTTEQDIHALAERLRAAGYAPEAGPEPLPWGPMAFAARDPDGFAVTVSNPE